MKTAKGEYPKQRAGHLGIDVVWLDSNRLVQRPDRPPPFQAVKMDTFGQVVQAYTPSGTHILVHLAFVCVQTAVSRHRGYTSSRFCLAISRNVSYFTTPYTSRKSHGWMHTESSHYLRNAGVGTIAMSRASDQARAPSFEAFIYMHAGKALRGSCV